MTEARAERLADVRARVGVAGILEVVGVGVRARKRESSAETRVRV